MAKTCDVFLTSYLPGRRERFGIDLDDIRAVNPDIIYVRGSGYGPQGPDADRPGYDGVSFWSRGGVCDGLTPEGAGPIKQTPAFGDLLGGMTIAGGIAAALYKRKATGETSVVDVSLLGLASYAMTPHVTAADLYGELPLPTFAHADAPNPLVGDYRTKDDRYVTLMMLQRDKFFDEFMHVIGRPDLIDDPRFALGEPRFDNRAELIGILDDVFATHTLDEWREILKPLSGAWGLQQKAGELAADPAVVANGYIPSVTAMSGAPSACPPAPSSSTNNMLCRIRRARARPAHRGDSDGCRNGLGRHRTVQGPGRDPMKFTITHPMHSHPYNPELVTGSGVAAMASAAEAAGFGGFGFTDHPAPTQRWLEAGGHDALDPFVAMGFAAAHTTTLRLIPNIVVLPYRNPFVVAKSGATLDLLSGGRFTLAIGVGYMKKEFAALGVDFEERGALLEEALDVIRTIWTTDDVSYEGRHFTAQGITAHPRPMSEPHPPIWIGGNTAAARRRVAEYGDGWCPFPAPAGLAQTARTAALDSNEKLAEGIDDLRRRSTRPTGIRRPWTSRSPISPAAARVPIVQPGCVPRRPGRPGQAGRHLGTGGGAR